MNIHLYIDVKNPILRKIARAIAQRVAKRAKAKALAIKEKSNN